MTEADEAEVEAQIAVTEDVVVVASETGGIGTVEVEIEAELEGEVAAGVKRESKIPEIKYFKDFLT